MHRHLILEIILLLAISFSFVVQVSKFGATMKLNTIGIVYGADGPIAGAYVSAGPADESSSGAGFAVTNVLGQYSMTTGLTNGTYNVTAFAYGYIMSTIGPVTVTAGAATTGVDFDLQTSGGISGTVTDAISGDPLNNTSIYAVISNGSLNLFGWFGTTGSDGKYLIATNLVTGMYNVSIGLPPDGYIAQMTTANVVAGVETKSVNLQLARSGIISGTVAAPNGTGLFGISVAAFSSGGGTPYFGFAETDLSGNYRIATGLGTGSYNVFASGDGNYSAYPTPVEVTAGLETSGIDIELTPFTAPPTPSGTILGRVTDQSNNPIVSATVTATGSNGTGFGETDLNGYYNITDGLGTGNDYNVSATASGYYDAYYPTLVSVTVGETTPSVNIQMTSMPLETFGTITGTVMGGPNPIPEFQYPLFQIISLTLAIAITGKVLLNTRRNRNKVRI